MKKQINEIKRMQQLAGIINESQVSEKFPSNVWSWDIKEFGQFQPATNTFMMDMDGDAFADYMDTEFPGWTRNQRIRVKGLKKYREDIKKAVEEEYGSGVIIDGEGFSY